VGIVSGETNTIQVAGTSSETPQNVNFAVMAVLLYPFFKLLPRMYGWIMQSKITRLYNEMRSIERDMQAQGPGQDADAMTARLDQLDQRANHLRLPTGYASTLYNLRAHIDLVREHLAISPDRKPH
jgi:hypothetical protein